MKRILIAFVMVGLSASYPLRHLAAAETRISIGVTETMDTFNPYADSVSLMYSVWCQVLGCLGTYDFDKGQHVGLVLERWEVKDPKTWLFHLRRDIKFHNGMPLTADDVVHSPRQPLCASPLFPSGCDGNYAFSLPRWRSRPVTLPSRAVRLPRAFRRHGAAPQTSTR